MNLDFTFEVKSAAAGQFEGLASTYHGIDDSGDRILPGAFAKTLQTRGAQRPVLWAHDQAQPVGLGTLSDQTDGLHIRGELDLDTQAGREADSRVRKGIVTGLSIGFRIPKGGADFKGSVREIKEIDLLEISLVAIPANREAQILSVKSLGSLRAYEHWLHTQGWSKSQATLLAKHGWQDENPEETEATELLAALKRLNAA